MKRAIAATILAAILVSGCASGISSEVREQAADLCGIYTELREPIVVARDGAIQYWDQFSPEQQKALKDIDAKLVQLDKYGQLSCLVAQGGGSGSIDWTAVKAALFDAVRLVVELRMKGVITKL